jgi:hypothetical protein
VKWPRPNPLTPLSRVLPSSTHTTRRHIMHDRNTEQGGVAVTPQTCIWEVLGSNIGLDTVYADSSVL